MHVRAKVVGRMLREANFTSSYKEQALWIFEHLGSDRKRIEIGLGLLFLIGAELDHDPALILRPYNPRIRNTAARYTPNANDPKFMLYRMPETHLEKTTGRKPGAERTVTTKGSDIGLRTKFDRLEGRTKKRPTRKICSQGFSKQKRRTRWSTRKPLPAGA